MKVSSDNKSTLPIGSWKVYVKNCDSILVQLKSDKQESQHWEKMDSMTS